jgi:hypothetical protein
MFFAAGMREVKNIGFFLPSITVLYNKDITMSP